MPSLYTPEEIDAIMEEYAETLRRGEVVSEDLAAKFKDAQKSVKGYTDSLNASLKSLKSSIAGLGSAMLEGKQGASQYDGVMKSGADTVANFASQFGILGMVVGGLIKAATAYTTAVTKQSDALYDSFQKMNQVGAVGAGGMSEVFENMQKMGYGIEQLGDMTTLLKENASTIAHFGGTVSDGAKALAGLSDQIVHSDLGRTFMNMGMTIDDINRGGASYLKLQTAMGRNSKDVGDQLSAGTVEYMTQLRMLSKITGDTLEAQQAKIDAAMSDEAVNQVMTELQQRIARAGPGGDKAAENQMQKIQALMASDMPEEMKKAMLGAMGGDAAAANKVFMTMPNAFKMLTDSSVSTNEFMDQTVNDISKTLDQMGGSAKVHAFGETFGDMKQLREYVAGGKWSDRAKSAGDNLVATDKATQAQTDLRVAQMNTRDSLQNMVNAGIVPVTNAMAALAEVTNGVAGIGSKSAIGGLAEMHTTNLSGSITATSGSGATASTAKATAVDQEMSGFGVEFGDTNVNVSAPSQSAGQIEGAIKRGMGTIPAGRPGSPSANLAAQATAPTTPVTEQTPKMATGGVTSGPTTGYQAVLHGTEAVVPLPDGKTIPVEMPDTNSAITEQTHILAQQLARFDELISVLRNQVSVSNKILQTAR